MAQLVFQPQSYQWAAFSIEFEGENLPITNVKLSRVVLGNLTHYIAEPNGSWHVVPVDYSGQVKVSSHSAGQPILALASSGSWSGGSNYQGFIAGKAGDVVWFNRKGQQMWLVFTENGFEYRLVNPGAKPVEVL